MHSARSNRGQKQLGTQSILGKVSGNSFSRFLKRSAGIEKDNHRRTSAAEDGTENSRIPSQFLQARQQRTECGAVRLVHAVFQRSGQQRVPPLRKSGEQQHGVLNVDHGVGAGILRRENAASFFGGKSLLGKRKQAAANSLSADADYFGFCFSRHARNGEAAHPAGGGVIGMMFAAGGFADDLRIGPAQTSEMICQGDAGQARRSGRTTAFADRNVVSNAKRKRNNLFALRLKNLAVGGEDKMIF